MNKLCECGCGKEVKNNRDTRLPNRFVVGHQVKGKPARNKNISHTTETKNKISNTIQSKEVQEKINKTKKELYNGIGYDSFLLRKKSEDTLERKTGFRHASQIPEIKEQFRQTWDNHSSKQTEEINRKKIQTSQDHFKTDHPMQSIEIQEKTKQSNLDHWGVDNYSKTPEFRQLARRLMKESILKNYPGDTKWCPRKGNYEKEVFDELQKQCVYPILEDQTFVELHPDRYIKELNLIIELYEPWHKRKFSSKHDLNRQKELEDHLGCKFFIIWLDDWKNNKEKIIEQFQILTKELLKCRELKN